MVDESLGESEGVSHLGNVREKSGVGEAAKGHTFKDQLFTGSAQYMQLLMCRKMATLGVPPPHLFFTLLFSTQWLDAAGRLLSGDYFPKSCGC
ncbi:unnamed protein product [Ectocarpus sp. 12 AP-2014]